MNKLNPWYITGFVEGEGCFAITISKHKTKKLGLDARLSFEIELRGDDRHILEMIKEKFRCGNIYDLKYERYGWMPHVKYHVRGMKAINEVIIPFFKAYPLHGKKLKDFNLFCEATEIFNKKEHLTKEGIVKIEKLREFLNKKRPFGG